MSGKGALGVAAELRSLMHLRQKVLEGHVLFSDNFCTLQLRSSLCQAHAPTSNQIWLGETGTEDPTAGEQDQAMNTVRHSFVGNLEMVRKGQE